MKSKFSWLGKIFSVFSRQTQKIQEKHRWDKNLVHSLNKAKLPSFKQLKYLGRILSRREKIQLQAISGIILICLILLLGQAYIKATAAPPKIGGEYTEALVGSPRLINPILAQTNDVDLDLSQLVFSGLLKYDKERRLVPDLAENYEISQDHLVYTFVLRKNIKWHDGSDFKADDVVFTVASIQDPEFNSPLSRSFRGVIAEKVDDNTVK
ncbi:MAG: ABC transporter substrate-binding protein, partial [Patescibacteria group bacterium]